MFAHVVQQAVETLKVICKYYMTQVGGERGGVRGAGAETSEECLRWWQQEAAAKNKVVKRLWAKSDKLKH